MTRTRLATFTVDELLLGIVIDRVQEVLLRPLVTPVPLAPAGVVGLLTLRGQILTVLDVRAPLGLPTAGDRDGATHCVVGSVSGAVSLVVDRAHDVVNVSIASITEVPATVPAAIRSQLTGVCSTAGGLLLVVDLDRLLAAVHGKVDVAEVRAHAGLSH